MKQIELTQGRVAIVDDELFDHLNQWKWFYGGTYAARDVGVRKQRVYMHRLVANTPVGMETDHINGNHLDNRRANLRITTRSQNMMNCAKRRDNRSGVRGVYWNKSRRKWEAYLNKDGKRYHLGRFSKRMEAMQVRRRAEQLHYGEYRARRSHRAHL